MTFRSPSHVLALVVALALVAIGGVVAMAQASDALYDSASSSATGPVARASACGSISLGGRTYVFFKSGLRCGRAKELARFVYRTHRPPDRRWRCSSGSGYRRGAFCRRPGATFAWHPGD